MKRAAWWGLCGVMLLAGCRDFALPGVNRPGRFNVVFQWDTQRPAAGDVLWVVGRVTETTNGAPRELSTAGPERYQPGMELRFSAVDRCDACVVAVEFREGQGSQAPEKYYGISNAFALHPNDNVTVTVRVALRGVPDPSGMSLEVVGPSGIPAARVNTSVVDVVARRLAGGTATVAGVSNLPSFPEDVEGATPRRSAEAPFTGDAAAFAAWDLLGGRAAACGASGDCALRVYGRLRDAEGYPSQSVFTDVVWDRTPPALQQQDGGLAASVRPAQPAGPELVSVQFTTNEPCRDVATLALPDVPALQFVLAGLRQDPFNTTYSFVALSPADVIADVLPHTLRATFTDVAGNTTQADIGTVQRDPNALALVGTQAAVTALNAAGGALPRDSSGPWFLTATDQVALDITFNRPLAGVPAVRFGARDPFMGGGFTCDGTQRCRGTFGVVTEDPDGELRVSVVASDQSERPPVTFELSRDITVDQTPPLVEFLWSATLVRPGQDVVLTALANEPVDWTGGAVPQLERAAAPPLLLVVEDGAPVGVQRRWRGRFLETAGGLISLDGTWALSVAQAAWQDRARNAPVVNLPPDVVVDSVPPVVSQVRVTPGRLGVGDALDVVVTAEVGDAPDGGVALEGAAEVRVEVAGVGGLCAPEAGTTWRCVVTVPDNLPDDNYAVTVQALDQAGNVGTDGTTLPVDRTQPGISYADLFYVPGAGNPLVQVTAAKSGTRVTVVLATTELVTQMRLFATRLGADVQFDGPPVTPSDTNPTAVGFFTLDVSPTLASGTYALRVELADRSGNTNLGGETLPALEVRNHTPTLLFAQDALALVRQPVGGPVTLFGATVGPGASSSSGGSVMSSSQVIMPASSGLVTGTEGGNVEADAMGPAATAPARHALLQSAGLAGTRAAPGVAAVQLATPAGLFPTSPPRVLRVLAWLDNGGPGAVLREVPWALAPGAPTQADVTWEQAPGRGVFLVGVDEAGNLSLPVPVMHTEVDIKPIEPENATNRSTLVATNLPTTHPLDLQARDLGLKDVFGAFEAAAGDGQRLQRKTTRHFTHIPPTVPVPGGEDWSGAYDPARDRWVVLTTKANGTTGLFEWDGLAWEERLLPTGAPGTWLGAAAAYHPLLGGVVFVGGCADRSLSSPYGGAWVWDGVTLRREGIDVPPLLVFAAAVYDPQRGALLLLGGNSACGTTLLRPTGRVWSHDGTGWVDLGATGLTPRMKAAAVYAPGRGVVVVGGQGSGALELQWLTSSNTFEVLAPGGTSPLPRAGHALVALPGGDVCLAGGSLADETPQGSLWCFNAVTVGPWRENVVLPPLVGQPPLMAVDVHRASRMLLLTARQAPDTGQTFALPTPLGPAQQVASVGMVAAPGAAWMTRGLAPAHTIHVLARSNVTGSGAEVRTWTGTSWTSPEDPTTIPRQGAAFFILPAGAIGFHGGVLDLGGPSSTSADFVGRGVNGQAGWKTTTVQGSPTLAYHAAAYHEAEDVTVLFGGMDTPLTVSAVTYHLVTTAGTSAFITPSLFTEPQGRYAAAMAYGTAPGLDHVVLYGGATFVDTAPLSDVWMYSPGGVWAQVAVQGVPPRQNHAMAFEDNTGCFVVVGGETTVSTAGGGVLVELTAAPLARLCWTAGGVTYSEPAVRGGQPEPANHMAAAFDGVNQTTVLLGGDGTPAVEGTWLLRTPPGPPSYTFVGDVSDARLGPTHALEVRVMANSGVDGGPPTGLLHVWNTGADAGGGRWVAAESPGGDGDVTLPARDTVWRGSTGAVVGAQVRGNNASEKVVLDAVEIRVRYCQRADGGVCFPNAGP